MKTLLSEKLISFSGTPNSGIITITTTKETSKTTISDNNLIRIPDLIIRYHTSLRFGLDRLKNLFTELSSSNKLIIIIFPSSFPTWTSTDDPFYYNLIKNKNKGPVKKKVTFKQTLTI